MAENKTLRLNKVLRELNISLDRAVEHLANNGFEIEARPTTKISESEYQILLDGFQTDANKKAASKEVGEEKRKEKEELRLELEEKKRKEEEERNKVLKAKAEKLAVKPVGKIDLDGGKKETPAEKEPEVKEEPVAEKAPETKEPEVIKASRKLSGPKVVATINTEEPKKAPKKEEAPKVEEKKEPVAPKQETPVKEVKEEKEAPKAVAEKQETKEEAP